jgi:hypothetical protein
MVALAGVSGGALSLCATLLVSPFVECPPPRSAGENSRHQRDGNARGKAREEPLAR